MSGLITKSSIVALVKSSFKFGFRPLELPEKYKKKGQLETQDEFETLQRLFLRNDLHALSNSRRWIGFLPKYRKIYNTVKSNFDYRYYLARNPSLAVEDMDPVAHYIRHGEQYRYQPTPWFLGDAYQKLHPKTKGQFNLFYYWLTAGKAKGEIPIPFPGYEKLQRLSKKDALAGFHEFVHTVSDLQERLEHGELGRMVLQASKVEPLVADTFSVRQNVKVPPLNTPRSVDRMAGLKDLHHQLKHKRFKAVVVVDNLRNLLNENTWSTSVQNIANLYPKGQLLVLVTREQNGKETPQISGDIPFVFLPQMESLSNPEKYRFVAEFLRSIRPDVVISAMSVFYSEVLSGFRTPLSYSFRSVLLCGDEQVPNQARGNAKLIYRFLETGMDFVFQSEESLERSVKKHAIPAGLRSHLHVMPSGADLSPSEAATLKSIIVGELTDER